MIEAPREIGTGSDYEALIEILRARQAEIGLTDGALEDLIDLAKGHVSKLFGATQPKAMGPFTFDAMFRALAIKFVVVHDAEMAAIMERQWERRERPLRGHTQRHVSLGKRTIKRVLPAVMSEMGKRGAAVTHAKATAEERSKSARHAVNSRWRKRRAARRQRSAAAKVSGSEFARATLSPVECRAPCASQSRAPKSEQAGAIRRPAARPRKASPALP